MPLSLIELLKPAIAKLVGRISNEINQIAKNRLLEFQVSQLISNAEIKTLLHRSVPRPLSEIYHPLYLKKLYSADSEKIPTDSAIQLFSRFRHITIIGTAGTGKTMLLKSLLIDCIKSEFGIPLKIDLRYLNKYSGNLQDYIFKEIFHYNMLAIDDQMINRLLDGELRFIFLFDGFDELHTGKREDILKDLENFLLRFTKNCYVITSRPYTDIEQFHQFRNFYIAPLDPPESKAFIEKQLPEGADEIKKKLIASIDNEENAIYQSYWQNPLLLTLYILTFQTYTNYRETQSDFFRQVFDTLYSTHDSFTKLTYKRERHSGVSRRKIEEILHLFSLFSYWEDKLAFSAAYFNEKIDLIKKDLQLEFDNSKLLNDLETDICILVKDGFFYSFPHRSLQEYFSALCIKNLDSDPKSVVYQEMLEPISRDYTIIANKYFFFQLLNDVDSEHIFDSLTINLLMIIHKSVEGLTTKIESCGLEEKTRMINLYQNLTGLLYFIIYIFLDFESPHPLLADFKYLLLENNIKIITSTTDKRFKLLVGTNDSPIFMMKKIYAYFDRFVEENNSFIKSLQRDNNQKNQKMKSMVMSVFGKKN